MIKTIITTSLKQWKRSRLIHLCIAVTFFTSGIIINLAQLILHCFLKPLNATLFRHLMYYLCYSLYSQLIFVAEWYSNSQIKLYMDEDDVKQFCGKEHVLLLMNHSYEIDWLCGWMMAEKFKTLGNCKAYAKKVISYIPVIGWAWKFAEFVFLERSFDKDKQIIARQLKIVYSYPDPVWLLLNAEGTRFTSTKHAASVKFAEERGLPILKHHLIPRTKGFTASLPSLRGRCPVAYDINLAFDKNAAILPTMSSLLNGESVRGNLFVRRIPLEGIPEDETAAAQWLQNFYHEKDRIIDSFHTTGSFFKTSGIPEVPGKFYPRRLCTCINYMVWSTLTISFILYMLLSSLILGNWITLSVVGSVLLIFYVLMDKAIGMSKISKASNYGSAKNK